MIIMQGDDICCIKVFLFLSDELYQNYFKQVKWINNTLIYFLDNAFLVRRKTFPKESYLMLFFDKLDRKYLSLNMQIFYTTVWNIFSLGENYHQELFFTLIKKKLKNITCLKTTWWFATSSLNKTNVLIIAFVKFLEIFIFLNYTNWFTKPPEKTSWQDIFVEVITRF